MPFEISAYGRDGSITYAVFALTLALTLIMMSALAIAFTLTPITGA